MYVYVRSIENDANFRQKYILRREYSKKPFMPNILVFCRARVMLPPGYHYAAGLVIFFVGLHLTQTAVGWG